MGLILVLLDHCQVAERVDFKFFTTGSSIYTSDLHNYIGPLVEHFTPEII